MSNSLLPMNNTDFWWIRYGLGILAPLVLAAIGLLSLYTRHSDAIWSQGRRITLVPVSGEQAILMGFAYIGMALMLFGNYFAQYHERMAYFYEWFTAVGAILAGGGIVWCSWIFLAR